ncbi:MAG: DUF2207 domain-containing protein [Ruminococcaceae bacterium]|nr:DUF2207 domain-containing protein [Oscillospiraceae bacterium]
MRKLRTFLILVSLCLLLCVGANAASCTGLRQNVTAGRDGSLECQLTLTCYFDISQQSLEIKLPAGATDITVFNARSEVTGETVKLLADSVFSGSVTFRVDYTLPHAFTYTQEGDQLLRVELVPHDLGIMVGYAEFTLTLPESYKNEPDFFVGTTATDKAVCTLDSAKIAGSLNQTVPAGDGLMLLLELPDDYFVVRENAITELFAGWRLLIVLLLVLSIVYWYLGFFRASHLPHVVKTPRLPDGVSAGELSVLLTGLDGDPAALIAEWASLGYVQLVKNNNGTYVRMLMNMGTERSELEYQFFARLFREADAVRLESEFYAKCARGTAERLRAHWVRRLFDKKSGSPAILLSLCLLTSVLLCLSAYADKGAVWAVASAAVGGALCVVYQRGVLSLLRHGSRLETGLGMAAGIAMLLIMAIFGGGTIFLALIVLTLAAMAVCHGGRRTALGLEKLEQTLGFRRHLLDADPQELRILVRQDSQYFYRMLPYAEALGVASSFASRFGNLKLEPCAWLADAPSCTAKEFYALFDPMAKSLRAKGKH